MAEKPKLTGIDYIVRGILIGGSMGVLVSITGIFEIDIFRGGGLGMVAGFLGGLTLARTRAGRNGQDGPHQ